MSLRNDSDAKLPLIALANGEKLTPAFIYLSNIFSHQTELYSGEWKYQDLYTSKWMKPWWLMVVIINRHWFQLEIFLTLTAFFLLALPTKEKQREYNQFYVSKQLNHEYRNGHRDFESEHEIDFGEQKLFDDCITHVLFLFSSLFFSFLFNVPLHLFTLNSI